jgi:IS5 family transposase
MEESFDMFRMRLDHMVQPNHPLVVLASRMPWDEIEWKLNQLFQRKPRVVRELELEDMFGKHKVIMGGGVSPAGRKRLPFRLMVSLLYLKHAYNESDESVVERWSESPVWQSFSGRVYYEHRKPCDGSLLTRFRQALGEEGVEELLAQTVNAAVLMGAIDRGELESVIVDSTVQEKAVAHPTDSRLLEKAREKLVEVAKDEGVPLKQTFAKEGKQLSRKTGRYAHAKQFKRMKKTLKRHRTIVGRLARDAERKSQGLAEDAKKRIGTVLGRVNKIVMQTKQKKRLGDEPKIYSFHAPEVECISKGKSRNPFEFGVKVGVATTLNGSLIVGARAFPGNPYDGHTLNEQLEQAMILMQDMNVAPKTVYVDLGYRGVDAENSQVEIVHRGKSKRLGIKAMSKLRRRQATEPVIGHLKSDHRMDRCHLKGSLGDSLHAVLCAAGYNIRWLMRMILKYGIRHFLRLIFGPMAGLFGGLLGSKVRKPTMLPGFMAPQAA